jgi:hypothetical protein
MNRSLDFHALEQINANALVTISPTKYGLEILEQ